VGRLFSFVVTLVVVGTCLFVATRIAIGQAPEADKPATPVPQRVRGGDRDQEAVSEPRREGGPDDERRVRRETADDVRRRGHTASPWRRVRSVVLLATLLTALGVVLALAIAIFGAVVLNALRSAVQ